MERRRDNKSSEMPVVQNLRRTSSPPECDVPWSSNVLSVRFCAAFSLRHLQQSSARLCQLTFKAQQSAVCSDCGGVGASHLLTQQRLWECDLSEAKQLIHRLVTLLCDVRGRAVITWKGDEIIWKNFCCHRDSAAARFPTQQTLQQKF